MWVVKEVGCEQWGRCSHRVRRGHCHVAARPATLTSILAAGFNELHLTSDLKCNDNNF